MPIYEYYCNDCRAVFEQLRPASRAAAPEPCPRCDSDAQRLMPTSFESFVIRDGAPRRIPDRGRFWHREREVGRPITSTVSPGDHPDLVYEKYGPEHPPSIEEQEAFVERQMQRLEYEAERVSSGLLPSVDQGEQHRTAQFVRRLNSTAEQAARKRRRAPNADVTPRTRGTLRAPAPDQRAARAPGEERSR